MKLKEHKVIQRNIKSDLFLISEQLKFTEIKLHVYPQEIHYFFFNVNYILMHAHMVVNVYYQIVGHFLSSMN